MEVDIQMIVIAAFDIHLKDPLGGLGEKRFFQSLQRIASTGFGPQIAALIQAAAPNSRRGVVLGRQPLFLCFVAQQVHPQCTVLQLLTDGYDQRVADLGFVFDGAHKLSSPTAIFVHYSTVFVRNQGIDAM